jgi:hypothetical protein
VNVAASGSTALEGRLPLSRHYSAAPTAATATENVGMAR